MPQGGGGLPDLLQYYKGEGGVSRDPKFVLRNIWQNRPKVIYFVSFLVGNALVCWYSADVFHDLSGTIIFLVWVCGWKCVTQPFRDKDVSTQF